MLLAGSVFGSSFFFLSLSPVRRWGPRVRRLSRSFYFTQIIIRRHTRYSKEYLVRDTGEYEIKFFRFYGAAQAGGFYQRRAGVI